MTEIEELKWSLQYEKKLNGEMINMLEHRVSTCMAEIDTHKKEATTWEGQKQESDTEIRELQEKIVILYEEISSQKIQNDKLRFEKKELSENVVSLVEFEKIQGQLSLANSEIKYRTGRMVKQHEEIENLVSSLKILHGNV